MESKDINTVTVGSKRLQLQDDNTGDNHKLKPEPEVRDLDSGWAWVVMFGSFGVFTVVGGCVYGIGIVHTALLENFKQSVSLTAWVGALHAGMLSAAGPLSSALLDRFSCRVAIVTAGMCYVIGFMTTAFAPNIETAIFTCGILAGLGGGLSYTAAMVAVGFYFKRRRNLALGFVVSGTGLGLFVMAPLMQLARDYYGMTGFFISMAAISANTITFGVLCFPSDLEIEAQQNRRLKAEKMKSQDSKNFASLRNYVNVLTNKAVICMCLGMFFYCFGTYLIYLHLPKYIILCGLTPTEASLIISISGLMSIIGRLLTGVIANGQCLPDEAIYSGSMAVVAIATFVFPLISDNFIGQVTYSVILGLFFGSCYVSITTLNIKFIGMEFMASAIGLEFFFGGLASIIGPVTAGLIVDAGGTYNDSFVVAACCILFGAISSAATVCFHQDRPSYNNHDICVDIREKTNDITLEQFNSS